MVKRLALSLIILGLILSSLSSQERISIEVSPNPVGVNDDFNVVIEVNHPESRDVALEKPVYPDGIQLRRGPYIRPATVNTKDGFSKKITRISFTFRSRRSGMILFDPFFVSIKDEVLTSPSFIMEVGTYINRKLIMPLEAEWSTPYDFVYTGEAVPLLLNVKNQKEIVLFDSVNIAPPAGGIFEEYFGVGEISSEILGSTLLYNVPASFAILTPTRAAKITIPSARVSHGVRTGETGRLILDVLPLPGEVAETGAIGRFTVTTRMEQSELYRMDEAVFRVRLEGVGNLNYLQMPVPEFTGADLLSSYESEDYKPDLHGYKGYREAVYTIKIGDTDRLKIGIPPFPYLERPSGKVIPSRVEVENFDILPALPEEVETAELNEVLLPLLRDGGPDYDFLDYQKGRMLLLLFLPGPLALLVFRLIRGKGQQGGRRTIFMLVLLLSSPLFFSAGNTGSLKERTLFSGDAFNLCFDYYAEGSFGEALTALDEVVGDVDTGFIFYNRGLILSGMNQWDEAVYNMASAVARQPQSQLYRDAYNRIINKGGFTSSYTLEFPLDRGFLFIILIILVNLLSLMLLLSQIRNNGILRILEILSSSFILVVLFLVFFTSYSASIPRGVVVSTAVQSLDDGLKLPISGTEGEGDPDPGDDMENDGIFFKKIPEDAGEEWLQVKPGTLLRIRDRAGDYLLAENGEKINGWIHYSHIRIVGDPE
ncbi:MAG: BatD family protein [Spirochaetales bacterium]|nr:BatD family protein [Spirochaetales bacterium]